MTRAQGWVITGSIVAVAGCLCGLVLTVRADLVQLPRISVETRGLLVDELRGLRADLVHQVDSARGDLTGIADKQLTGVRADAVAQIANLTKSADGRIGDSLARVDRALGVVERLEGDAQPVLANAASLTAAARPVVVNAGDLLKDAKDSWDDLYTDVQASVASSTVMLTSVAYASEAVRDAAPKVAESVVGVGKSVDGIAADVHSITTGIARPKGFFAKLRSWLETAGKVGARLL